MTTDVLPIDRLSNLIDRACRHLTPQEANALRGALAGTVHNAVAAIEEAGQQRAELTADLERARRVAVALENDNARLEAEAASGAQAAEKADRECDEHIGAAREFRKWGEECQRVGTRFWLAWKSARQRADAERSRAETAEYRASLGPRAWDEYDLMKQRAERAEQQLAQHATLLAGYVQLADITHKHAGRHDNLGANLSCAGCALRDRAAAALDGIGEGVGQQLANVRALHTSSQETRGVGRGSPWTPFCDHCHQDWPCATIRALDGAQQPAAGEGDR